MAIFLAPRVLDPRSPVPPYVRIYIDRHVTELTERQWVVAGSGVNAGAWYHHGSERETATSGVVNVTSVAADNTIEGTVDLTFPSGAVRRTFRAGWTPMSGLCP